MTHPQDEALSASRIQKHLVRDVSVFLYDELDSTNAEARRLLSAGQAHGAALVLAEAQHAGRGRRGRAFYSPARTGLYMTLALAPQSETASIVRVTTAAAVAVALAIESLTTAKPQIKWVNDIFLDNRKICGILAENVADDAGNQRVIVGVGVNIATEFPEALANVAGSLNAAISRNHLAAEIVNRLQALTENLDDTSYLDAYRARSSVLGQAISYEQNGEVRRGTALYVDDMGGLIVRRANGSIETLQSGEITVRTG